MNELRKIFSKKNVPVFIGILVIAAIIYYFATKKKDPSNTPPPPDIIGGNLLPEQVTMLTNLSQNLYNDMNGANISIFGIGNAHNIDLYKKTATLSDTELVALSNIFNYNYQEDSGETFLQWLEDENFSWESFEDEGLVNSIIDRLIEKNVS